MQMRHAGGAVVGVYVLASTGTARARSHTPRGLPPAHSILFDLYPGLIVPGRGWVGSLELRRCTRCRWCAPARCRSRLAARLLLASCLLEMSLACQFAHGTPQHAGCLLCPLILPSLSRHWPGARRLGCALPSRFTGRRHSSTWQDTDTTATNLGQIRCRGICAF